MHICIALLAHVAGTAQQYQQRGQRCWEATACMLPSSRSNLSSLPLPSAFPPARPPRPQATQVVGPHTCRDFVVIREDRNGDLQVSLKRMELSVS